MDLGYEGRTALVAGGSRGIGREIALTLATEGANIAVCGRDREALERVGSAVRMHGVKCLEVVADLSRLAGCKAFVERAVEAFGRVDVLVNSVTGAASVPSDGQEVALLQRIQNKALPGIRCSRLVIPHMAAAGGGSIVFIGGLSVRMPFNDFGPFAALEPGTSELAQGLGNAVISNYAKHLSDEVGKFRITVNVVHPSIVMTERVRSRLDRYIARTGTTIEAAIESLSAAVPIGRLVEPADIAATVAFFGSRQAAAVTGQSVAVDGGFGRVVLY